MRRLAFAALLVLAACSNGICDPTGALHRSPCTPLTHPIPYHPELVCQEDVPT